MAKKDLVPSEEKKDLFFTSFEEDLFPRRRFFFNDYLFDSMQRYMEDMYRYHDNMFGLNLAEDDFAGMVPRISIDVDKYFSSVGNSFFKKDLFNENMFPLRSVFRNWERTFWKPWEYFPEKHRMFRQNKMNALWKKNSGMQVSDNGNDIVVSLDVQGIPKEDVKVNISNGNLEVLGNVKKINEKQKNEGDINCFMKQSYQSSFYSSFPLPENVEQHNIRAKLKDGKLNVIMPKKNETKTETEGRSIKVD